MLINIANDYTKKPGGRHYTDGDYSGEDFRDKLLKPKFLQAQQMHETLTVNLDGGYGYGPSFLEEAYGGLARELWNRDILNIKIISDEEPIQIEKIREYITRALDGK